MKGSPHPFFLELLEESIKPATGCTEPCAIALNTATARKHARGAFQRLVLRLDECLYKNAMGVGLPGTKSRGVPLCAALGVTAGNADAGINVLCGVLPEQVVQAKALVAEGRIVVELCPAPSGLFVQTELITDEDHVRVITTGAHDNIVSIEHAPFSAACERLETAKTTPILDSSLQAMLAFVNGVPPERLLFLQEGVDMNLAVATAGEALPLGQAMYTLMHSGALGDSPISRAKVLTASACYARMVGVPLPVMTATGSGNQGITVTLTIEGVAQYLRVGQEQKLRALALAHLVNLYAKAHVGNLSALCACGIASGLGASVAVVYLLDGTPAQMMLAAQNMVGSICGMICDGAKEGCANKVALAAGVAVESAYLALEGAGIPCDNGILSDDWGTLFGNLGALARDGMQEMNHVIVRLMRPPQCVE